MASMDTSFCSLFHPLLLVNDGFFGINRNLETVEVEWLLGVTSQDIDRWDYRE